MKKLLFLLLSCVKLAAFSQSLDQAVDAKIKASETRLKAYADSLFKVKGDGGTQNPPTDLPKCKRGPAPGDVYNVTTTSAMVLWDGEDVRGWDYSIYKGTTRVAFGSVKPTSNREPITYAGLEPGEYTLSIQGNTCKSDVYSKPFTVPKPSSGSGGGDTGNNGPPPALGKYTYQLIMGTTGSGFDPTAKHGIKEGSIVDGQYQEGWVDRIEATKFDWGYGISGIALWVAWDSYEPYAGRYEEEAFKRVIEFCRDRDLSLSVVFMRRRAENDGFIGGDEIIVGSGGTRYIEGVPGFGSVYAGYANDRVNALSRGAIKSIARLMASYDKSFYIALAGGGAGEQVNYVFKGKKFRELGDFSPDNAQRYDAWRSARGIAPPGLPAVIQGPGIDWPHVDYNDVRGEEFARSTTYGLRKAFDAFAEAVRSETNNLVVTYLYSVTSNLQFRSIANPNINWIAENADGLYGSDGDGIGDQVGKIKVNSLNLGTFPRKVSMAEEDVDDVTNYKEIYKEMPPYCVGGIFYNVFEATTRNLFTKGLMAMNLAMAWCTSELRGMEPTFKSLNQDFIRKEYKWPDVNASNTNVVDVTEKYRKSIDLMQGLDYEDKYTKYISPTFFGGVNPEVGDGGGPAPQPSKDYSPVKSYVEANLANAYNWNVVFDLRSPDGELYSFEKGGKTKDTRFKVMSHSKFVTGVIISYLIDQGKLSLDTRVGDVIRSWDRPDRAGITIRQIMGHMSGIPDNTDNDDAETLEYFVDELVKKPGFTTPNQTFKYSTAAYQVAARMAEIETGKSWKDLFREILVVPCEMGNAEFHPADGILKARPLNPNAGYGLYCTVKEWMNFIGMIRDGGAFKGRRVLNPRVFEILKTQTSPGWSDWGVGVMIKDSQYVSEAASGCGTFISPGRYAAAIFTQSDYNSTYWQNVEVRNMVKQIYEQ